METRDSATLRRSRVMYTEGSTRTERTGSRPVLRAFAVLLSLVRPGLGHFLVGRFLRGAVWVFGLELLLLAAIRTIPLTLWIFALVLAITVIGPIAAAIDTARIAPLRHSWMVLLLA